jgi:hypothetical protein
MQDESKQAIADVRQGRIDYANGIGESAADAFAEIRRRLGWLQNSPASSSISDRHSAQQDVTPDDLQ